MAPPTPPAPEILLRKPGTVTAAQTLMWIQFSFLVCCGTGGTFVALFSAGILDRIDLDEGFAEDAENLAVLIAAVIAVMAASAVLFGVLAAKLGAGRRWAQITTIAVMLVVIVFGFAGMATDFKLEERTGAPVEGSDFVAALLSLALPMVTLICLSTGSANQWFRQRGPEPWQRYWQAQAPRYPFRY